MHEYEFFQGNRWNVQRGVGCFENRAGINKTRSNVKRMFERDTFYYARPICTFRALLYVDTRIHNEIANILF